MMEEVFFKITSAASTKCVMTLEWGKRASIMVGEQSSYFYGNNKQDSVKVQQGQVRRGSFSYDPSTGGMLLD